MLSGFGSAVHADAAAGKATFTAVCAECHDVADFEGEDAAALRGTLKQIVAGTQKHKKALTLTDAQIADVAAYMTGGR
jgi:mono/diheme cytochrome c family protein